MIASARAKAEKNTKKDDIETKKKEKKMFNHNNDNCFALKKILEQHQVSGIMRHPGREMRNYQIQNNIEYFYY